MEISQAKLELLKVVAEYSKHLKNGGRSSFFTKDKTVNAWPVLVKSEDAIRLLYTGVFEWPFWVLLQQS
jgi:hypothetical protein